MTWSMDEQLHLVDACNHALDRFPGVSLCWPSAELKNAVYCEFVELSGNACRTEEATLAACGMLMKAFERMRSVRSSKVHALRPKSAKRLKQSEETVPNMDDEVFDAVADLIRAHPAGTACTEVRCPTRTTPARSSRAPWNEDQLELLARAFADIGLSTDSSRGQVSRSELFPTFMTMRGSKKRTRGAVVAAAWRMLLARQFVLTLDACHGSWESWLELPKERQRELSLGMKFRVLLLRMNRSVFSALDEATLSTFRGHSAPASASLQENEDEAEINPDSDGVLQDEGMEPEVISEVSDGAQYTNEATTTPLQRESEEGEQGRASDHVLLRTVQAFGDTFARIHTGAVESRHKQWENITTALLRTISEGDSDRRAADHLIQKQAADVEESMQLMNTQSEEIARLTAMALGAGTLGEQEDRQ